MESRFTFMNVASWLNFHFFAHDHFLLLKYSCSSTIAAILLLRTFILKDPIILQRTEGTVIWYSLEQGYGIVRQNLNKKTISIDQSQIHYNSLKDVGPLSIGQRVSFVVDNLTAQDLYIL